MGARQIGTALYLGLGRLAVMLPPGLSWVGSVLHAVLYLERELAAKHFLYAALGVLSVIALALILLTARLAYAAYLDRRAGLPRSPRREAYIWALCCCLACCLGLMWLTHTVYIA